MGRSKLALPVQIAPNPRLQRMPAAAPPSPLSRQPLGAGGVA